MDLFRRFDGYIEKQQWNHLTFLRLLTIILFLSILLLFLWILLVASNGYFTQEFLLINLQQLGISLLLGLIAGLVLSFVILLRYYRRQFWDLHVIVPNFLFILIVMATITQILLFVLDEIILFSTNGIVLGFLMGGMIAIVAYAGEVEKEHKAEEEPLIIE